MHESKEAWAEYMREYRRRRRLNNYQPLGRVRAPGPAAHQACDAEIARLQGEVARLREMLKGLEF